MRTNKQIRVPRVRLIDSAGQQVGIVLTEDALKRARLAGLDLVEMVPNSSPPVCKILDYGKYRYDQTKREKENRKTQHQVRVKEVKLKPNIDRNDLQTKIRKAREFLEKGNKVKVSCFFRGREMLHKEIGRELIQTFCDEIGDLAVVESPPKLFGRMITTVIAPNPRKKKPTTTEVDNSSPVASESDYSQSGG